MPYTFQQLLLENIVAWKDQIEILKAIYDGQVDTPKTIHSRRNCEITAYRGYLCLVDALGGFMNPSVKNRSKENFINTLIEYADSDSIKVEFSLVYNKILFHYFEKEHQSNTNKFTQDVKDFLSNLELQNLYCSQKDFEIIINSSRLDQKEKSFLNRNVFHGTGAALIYERIRIAAIHGFGHIPFIFPNGTKAPSFDSLIKIPEKIVLSLEKLTPDEFEAKYNTYIHSN